MDLTKKGMSREQAMKWLERYDNQQIYLLIEPGICPCHSCLAMIYQGKENSAYNRKGLCNLIMGGHKLATYQPILN